MSLYTKKELETAKEIVNRHKVLGITFLQIAMNIGFGKSANIVSELRKDKKYQNLPENIGEKANKISINHIKRNENKDLSEKLYELLNDEKGREIVKLCMKDYKEERKSYRVMFNEIQNKYSTGYGQTDKYLQIAKFLIKKKKL